MQNKAITLFMVITAIFLSATGCGQQEFTDVPVTNRLLEAADGNRNGMTDREEMNNLIMILRNELRAPHDIRNPVIGIADLNQDGFLDEKELDIFHNLFSFRLLPRLFDTNPDLARKLDRNSNNKMDQNESQAVKMLISARDRLSKPRKVEEPWDKAMDLDQDNFVDDKEIETIINNILLGLVKVPFDINQEIDKIQGNVPGGDKDENRIQEILDLNKDGMVQDSEIKEISNKFFESNIKPGEIKDPAAFKARFDLNRDGFLSEEEIQEVRGILERTAEKQKAQQQEVNKLPLKEPADAVFDINSDGFIDRGELDTIRKIFDKMEKTPHKAGDADRKIDLNRDGKVALDEIKTVGNRLKNISNAFIQTGKDTNQGKTVENLLEELADVNNDRFLDPEEINIMDKTLSKADKVRNEFGKRIDFNGSNEVEPFEIEKALRARSAPLNGNQAKMPEKVKALTAVDGIFDLNGDGFIGKDEVDLAIAFFIKGPGAVDPGFKPAGIFDLNKDQFISQDEMRFVQDNFLRPHPVNDKFDIDKKSDRNSNGFIEPGEIGVAAGHTAAGVFSTFEEMIEQKQIRQEESMKLATEDTGKPGKVSNDQPSPSPAATPQPAKSSEKTEDKTATIYQKKIDIKNKKIAVVDLKTGADIGADFSDAIIMFAENAFVNIGTAIVVDRQNIAKIIKEYEFQASDLADTTKAAQIGKLAGAEVIVIGNLNYVGKKYYLNIKLIDVTTAQILGSSIDTADDDTGFFDMCNSAVAKLF